MSTLVASPSRRNYIIQEVRIADQRTLYISVHDAPSLDEIFLRVKGPDCTPDTIASLMSTALQYGGSS